MSTYNTKNYMAHGGNELVIGGKLTFLEGAAVEGLGGAMEKAENVPESVATTVAGLKEDFNTLLSVLKAAGFMEEDAPDDGDDDEGNGDNEGDENGGGEDT